MTRIQIRKLAFVGSAAAAVAIGLGQLLGASADWSTGLDMDEAVVVEVTASPAAIPDGYRPRTEIP